MPGPLLTPPLLLAVFALLLALVPGLWRLQFTGQAAVVAAAASGGGGERLRCQAPPACRN